MMNGPAGFALFDGHVEGAHDKFRLHVTGHGPANDPAAEGVDNDRQIQKALGCRHIGDVANIKAVWLIDREMTIDQIARRRLTVVANRCADLFAPTDPLKAFQPHQPGDPLAADRHADRHQFGMNARSAVGPARSPVNGSNADPKALIITGSL